jgi:pyruvate/2-oxoglutarate dehydrogenase complex dihydrolipoamide dehydrogenase (E3) component
MAAREYDIVVIGGGSAGLVATAGPALFGARVALVEKAPRLGGDCLNYGCVPSKALVKAAKVAYHGRRAARWGLPELHPRTSEETPPQSGWRADLSEVMGRVRAAIDHIEEHHDNPDRFRELGADVLVGDAPEFVDPHTLRVGKRTLTSRHFLIGTGSRPAIPPVSGLEETGYWTNETVWEQTELPDRLMVIGAGPIGCEMAQAFHRLGSDVTLCETLQCVLQRDDHELACALRDIFIRDGIDVRVNSRVTAARMDGNTRVLTLHTDPDLLHDPEGHVTAVGEHEIPVDAILVATGRRPNVEGLNLDGIGVETSAQGIVVDEKLRTTVPNIYAAGDVIGGYLFTHVAEAEAKVVVGNVLFPGSRKMDYSIVPWSTFTDPELARVGLTEQEARQEHGDAVRVYRFPFADLDRAVCDAETDGLVKVVTNRKGKILGAHILGASAGELIHEFVIAMKHGLNLSALADTMHIYPTLSQADRRAADAFMKEKYLGDEIGLAGRFLAWWASRHARG